MIILSISFPAVADLPKDLFTNLPPSVPVVDTSNYYPGLRNPRVPEVDAGQVESLWVVEQIRRPVIKAFNNILSRSLATLGRPQEASNRLAIAIAGDDAPAKAIVSSLVNEIGFDPVDAGALAESWRQQPSTPVCCCDWDAGATRKALTSAKPG